MVGIALLIAGVGVIVREQLAARRAGENEMAKSFQVEQDEASPVLGADLAAATDPVETPEEDATRDGAVVIEETRPELPIGEAKIEKAKPEEGIGAINGIVVYPDGTRVSGARVGLIRKGQGELEGRPPRNVWKTTRTDSDGRFRFSNLPMIEYGLIASAPEGLFLRTVPCTASASPKRMDRLIILELRAAGPIAGIVVNTAGSPVEGAIVYPSYDFERPTFPHDQRWRNALAATTDVDGRFRCENLFAPRWKLLVTADDYASTLTDFIEVGTEDARITLRAGGRIEGEVVYGDDGTPVADVMVSAGMHTSHFDVHSAKTDSEGAFTLAGLKAGDWLVGVDDAALVSEAPSTTVSLGEGDVKRGLRIEVMPGGTISGIVLEAEEGTPIRDVQVRAKCTTVAPVGSYDARLYAEHHDRSVVYSVPTDASGRFTVFGLVDGSYALEGIRNGYAMSSEAKTVDVAVVAGEDVAGIELLMAATEGGYAIRGVVEDARGEPVSGASVYCESGTESVAFTYADRAGEFELAGLPNTAEAYVGARVGSDLASSRLGPFDVTESDVEGVVITLEAAASMDGRLLDVSGQPLMAAGAEAIICAEPVSPSDAPSAFSYTGREGWYMLSGLTEGTYAIYAYPKPNRPFPPRKKVDEVHLSAGQELTDYDLIYELEDQPTISGTVTRANWEPVEGAVIVARGPSRSEATSAADGTYVLRGLEEDGVYDVAARSSDYGGDARASVAAGSENIDFILAGTASIKGQVLSQATGAPIREFTVSHTDENPYGLTVYNYHGDSTTFSDEDGVFQLSCVSAGTVRVTASAAGYSPSTQVIEDVADGELVDGVVFYLESGGKITGCVTDNGEPASGQYVWVSLTEEGSSEIEGRTNAQGGYTLTSVPTGEVYVGAGIWQSPTWRSRQRLVVVEVGEVTEVNFDFAPATGTVEGTVSFGSNPPQEGTVYVTVTSDEGRSEGQEASIGADGTYSVQQVPAGLASILVDATSLDGGHRAQRDTVETRAGEVTRYDVAFTGTCVISGNVIGVYEGEQARVLALPGTRTIVALTEATERGYLQRAAACVTLTGGDGPYRFDGLDAGTYTVLVYTYDSARLTNPFGLTRCETAHVTAEEGMETLQDLYLP